MARPRSPRDGERGAAVLLFVALVVAAAIAATASMMIGRPQFAVQQGTGTGFDLTALRKAVEAHAIVVNSNAVVCPDTDDPADGQANRVVGACASPNGAVPWRDIGVNARMATDAWQQPVQLVAAERDLRSYRAGDETGCDFILVSGGADRQIDADLTAPVIDVQDTAAGTDIDLAVCGKLGDPPGSDADFDLNRENADGTKDIDLVAGTTDSTAEKTVAPYAGDLGDTGEKAVVFGEQDADGTFKKVQTNNYTSCFWIDHAFKFEETLRAYFEFRFFPGQNLDTATADKETGDGFTFALLPGNRDTKDGDSVVCGKAGHNQGLGYKDGVPLPKMAVEFDIYNNNYGDENALRHNHAGLLLTWRTDYIGNGSADNPRCRAQDLSTFGSENPCTHRRAIDGFAQPNVIFMEERDSETFDYIEGGVAGKLYPVRVELNRNCNDDCSACGSGAGTKMRTKVWIRCEDAECKTTNADFTGDWTENSINYCHADPSVEYMALNPATTPTLLFDTTRVGFTMGSNGFNTGVVLTNIILSSK